MDFAEALLPEGLFDVEELARLHREIRYVGTEFLFSRAVLLCEGPSELGALPEFAVHLEQDLDRLGVTLIAVNGGAFEPYLKLLGPDGFDIPHALVCDNDRTLNKLVKTLKRLNRLPGGVSTSSPVGMTERTLLASSGVFTWSAGDLETYLVAQGGYPAFEQAANFLYPSYNLSEHQASLIANGKPAGEVETVTSYVKRNRIRKPELAAEAARRFDSVPDEIRHILEHVLGLAAVR